VQQQGQTGAFLKLLPLQLGGAGGVLEKIFICRSIAFAYVATLAQPLPA